MNIPSRKCAFCGHTFKPKKYDAYNCSTACSKNFDNLTSKRARVIYRAAYHWRANRAHPQTAADLRFMCREIMDWVKEDRQIGRPPPPRHDHDKSVGHEVKPARTVASKSVPQVPMWMPLEGPSH